MFDYLQKFNNLSPSLRAKVSSPSVMATISELENKYKVDLAMLVMKVMIKSIAVKDLPAYFISELGLSSTVAENLSRELKEKIFILAADHLGLNAEKQSLDLDNNIQEFIKEAGIVLPSSVLVTRFKNIISIYLRGIRNKIDTKNSLAKNVKIGGLDLSEVEIERVLKICDSHRFTNVSQTNQTSQTNQAPVNQQNSTEDNGDVSEKKEITSERKEATLKDDPEKMLPKTVSELRDEPSEMLPGPDSILSLSAGLNKPLKSPLPLESKKTQTPPLSLKSEKSKISSITSAIPEYDLKREIADGRFKQLKIFPPEVQLDLPGVEKLKLETSGDQLKISSSEKPLDSQKASLTDKKNIPAKLVLSSGNVAAKPVLSSGNVIAKAASSLAPLRPIVAPATLKSVLALRPFKKPSFWSKFNLFKKNVANVVSDKKQVLLKETLIPTSTSKPAPEPSPSIIRPVPTPSAIRPAMHDIKSVPKVMGPIEELQFLDIVNFRRLGKTPEEATDKILLKIKLLEKDGYDKMVAGVLAWRKSPVNRLYLRLGQEALNKDVTLKDYVSAHQEDDREYLNWEEISALVSLNSKLIF